MASRNAPWVTWRERKADMKILVLNGPNLNLPGDRLKMGAGK